LQGNLIELEISLADKTPEEISKFFVQHLGELKNLDKTITARQIIFNEVLVFIVSISTPGNFETNNPDRYWEQFLDIELTARDLKNILGIASIITTMSEHPEKILMNVRMNIPFAKDQIINYSIFNFGRLWRFGDKCNYLLVNNPIQPQHNKVEIFLTNSFPYTISLNLTIKENYKFFLEYQKQCKDMEAQMDQHNQELVGLENETDSIMLAIRKDHVEEINKSIMGIKNKISNYAERLDLNFIKLETSVQTFSQVNDHIFVEDIKLANEYNEYVQNWMKSCNNRFNKISSDIFNYIDNITEIIDKLKTRSRETISQPKKYTPVTPKEEILPIEVSPYKKFREKYMTGLTRPAEILDSIPLEWCSSYILIEQKPSRSLRIFSDLVTEKFLGLCISPDERETIIKKFNILDTYVYQIKTDSGEYFVPPILSKISHLINDFLSNNVHGHGIIYLNGIDFLIQSNDFNRVLKFNNNIKESIVLNDSILIMSVKDSSIEESQLALLLENSINLTNYDVEFEDLVD
jgi:hypothetical protein